MQVRSLPVCSRARVCPHTLRSPPRHCHTRRRPLRSYVVSCQAQGWHAAFCKPQPPCIRRRKRRAPGGEGANCLAESAPAAAHQDSPAAAAQGQRGQDDIFTTLVQRAVFVSALAEQCHQECHDFVTQAAGSTEHSLADAEATLQLFKGYFDNLGCALDTAESLATLTMDREEAELLRRIAASLYVESVGLLQDEALIPTITASADTLARPLQQQQQGAAGADTVFEQRAAQWRDLYYTAQWLVRSARVNAYHPVSTGAYSVVLSREDKIAKWQKLRSEGSEVLSYLRDRLLSPTLSPCVELSAAEVQTDPVMARLATAQGTGHATSHTGHEINKAGVGQTHEAGQGQTTTQTQPRTSGAGSQMGEAGQNHTCDLRLTVGVCLALLEQHPDPDIRKQVYDMGVAPRAADVLDSLGELAKIRQQIAGVYGYPEYSHIAHTTTALGSTPAALAFLVDFMRAMRPAASSLAAALSTSISTPTSSTDHASSSSHADRTGSSSSSSRARGSRGVQQGVGAERVATGLVDPADVAHLAGQLANSLTHPKLNPSHSGSHPSQPRNPSNGSNPNQPADTGATQTNTTGPTSNPTLPLSVRHLMAGVSSVLQDTMGVWFVLVSPHALRAAADACVRGQPDSLHAQVCASVASVYEHGDLTRHDENSNSTLPYNTHNSDGASTECAVGKTAAEAATAVDAVDAPARAHSMHNSGSGSGSASASHIATDGLCVYHINHEAWGPVGTVILNTGTDSSAQYVSREGWLDECVGEGVCFPPGPIVMFGVDTGLHGSPASACAWTLAALLHELGHVLHMVLGWADGLGGSDTIMPDPAPQDTQRGQAHSDGTQGGLETMGVETGTGVPSHAASDSKGVGADGHAELSSSRAVPEPTHGPRPVGLLTHTHAIMQLPMEWQELPSSLLELMATQPVIVERMLCAAAAAAVAEQGTAGTAASGAGGGGDVACVSGWGERAHEVAWRVRSALFNPIELQLQAILNTWDQLLLTQDIALTSRPSAPVPAAQLWRQLCGTWLLKQLAPTFTAGTLTAVYRTAQLQGQGYTYLLAKSISAALWKHYGLVSNPCNPIAWRILRQGVYERNGTDGFATVMPDTVHVLVGLWQSGESVRGEHAHTGPGLGDARIGHRHDGSEGRDKQRQAGRGRGIGSKASDKGDVSGDRVVGSGIELTDTQRAFLAECVDALLAFCLQPRECERTNPD